MASLGGGSKEIATEMSVELKSQKAALRAGVLARLLKLSADVQARESIRLNSNLLRQAVWRKAQSVLLFAPMKGEPDIWALLEQALAERKQVALPWYDREQGVYLARLIKDMTDDLHVGSFGIREPLPTCPAVSLNRLDLVLVSGVAFDLHGRRLGRGKGYYDRLLAGYGGTKCGVAFDEQIVAEVPAEPHDIRVNCILTPTRWIET